MIETYRTTGDLKKAGEMVAIVADATRNSGDLYLIPDRMRTLALLKMDLGEYGEANQLLTEATDYVDAMLANSLRRSRKLTHPYAPEVDHLRG